MVTNPVSDFTEAKACLQERGYEVMDLIGCGHFAACYTVRDLRYGPEVFCVKVIAHSAEEDRTSIVTFRAELDTLMSLTHPNIITVYAHFSSSNYSYLILEYCEKGSLQELLAKEGRLPYDRLRDLFRQLLGAMSYLHSCNFCHRDIKPANILIDKYGRMKLADFGFASHYTEKDGKICGSVPYMSPELIQRRMGSDPIANDVWALGITFYEMAFGSLPWTSTRGEGISAEICAAAIPIPTDCPPNLMLVLRKMLQVEPARRGTMQDIMKMPLFEGPRLAPSSSGTLPTLRPTSGQGSRMSLGKHSTTTIFTKPRLVRKLSMSVPEGDGDC
jgi:serine/threonine protein kinase